MSDDLGARLVTAGLITRAQLSMVLGTAPPHEGALVAELVRQGVDEDALAGYFVASGFGPLLEPVDLSGLDPDVIRRVPARMANELLALPVRASPAGLIVAMVAPSDRHALAELVRAVGGGVLPTVARLVDLTIALRRAYPEADEDDRDSDPPLELVQRRPPPRGEDGYVGSTRGVERVEARALVGPRLVVEDEEEGVMPLVRHKPLITPLPPKKKVITKSFEKPTPDTPAKRPSVVVPPGPATKAEPPPAPAKPIPDAVPKAPRTGHDWKPAAAPIAKKALEPMKPSASAKAEALPKPPPKGEALKPSAGAKAEVLPAMPPRAIAKIEPKKPALETPSAIEIDVEVEESTPAAKPLLRPVKTPATPIAIDVDVEVEEPPKAPAKPIAKEPPKPRPITQPIAKEPPKAAQPIAKEPPKPRPIAQPIAKEPPKAPIAQPAAKPKEPPKKPAPRYEAPKAATSAPKLEAPARARVPSVKTLPGAPAPEEKEAPEGQWAKGERAPSQPPPKPKSIIPPEHSSWEKSGPDTKVDPVKLTAISAPPKRALRPPPIGGTLAAIRASKSRDEVVELACRGALTVCRAALLLALKKGVLKGWDGAGGSLTRDVVRNLWIPTKSPSMFRDVVGKREPYAGAHGTTAADGLFRAAVGSRGADVVLQPVAVGGKVVAVLAADDVGFDREGTERIEVLARAVGEAFERIIVAGKQ